VDQARQLEQQIQQVLGRDQASEAEIQNLINMKGEASAILPSDGKLKFVNSIEELLIAFQMATSHSSEQLSDAVTAEPASVKGRLKLAVAEALLLEANDLIQSGKPKIFAHGGDSEVMSVLGSSLLQKLQVVRDELQNMISSVQQAVASMDMDSLAADSNSEEIVSYQVKLAALDVITPQEEFLDFQQISKDFQVRCHQLTSPSTPVDLMEAETLIDEIETTLENNVTDLFPASNSLKSALKRSLNMLVDAESTAKKLWKAVSHAMDACRSDNVTEAVSFEDLTHACTVADETKLVNTAVRSQVISVLNESCEALPSILKELSLMTDASTKCNELALKLIRQVSHLVLPRAIRQDLMLRCEVCIAVSKCQHILQLEHGNATNAENKMEVVGEVVHLGDTHNLHSLRELRHTLDTLQLSCESNHPIATTENEYKEIEFLQDEAQLGILKNAEMERSGLDVHSTALSLLATVRAEISLRQWCAEVQHLWLHPTSLSAAEKLLEDASHLADRGPTSVAVSETAQWAELRAEIKAATDNSEALEQLVTKFSEIKNMLSPTFSGTVEQEIENWLRISGEMEVLFTTSIQKAKSTKILQAEAVHRAQEELYLLNLVNSACQCHLTLTASMSASAVDNAATALAAFIGSSSSTAGTRPLQPAIDIKELTGLANRLSVAIEKENEKMNEGMLSFLRNLSNEFSKLHQNALQWNDRAQMLHLHKISTRQKQKHRPAAAQSASEPKGALTRADVEKFLLEPIALAVKTPMYDSLVTVLADAAAFRNSLVTFLLPSEKEDQDFDSVRLQSELLVLYALRDKLDLILLELSEGRVLHWLIEVFEWMKALQVYPNDDPKDTTPLTFAAAKRKLGEGDPIINDVDPATSEILIDLKVYSIDESAGPVGFHPATHPFLKLSGDFYDFLSEQVDLCEQLQNKVQDLAAGYAPASDPNCTGDSLSKEFSKLLVLPDPSIKKLLDKLRSNFDFASNESKSSSFDQTEKAGRLRHGKAPQLMSPQNRNTDDDIDSYIQSGHSNNYWNSDSVLSPDSPASPGTPLAAVKSAEKERKKAPHSCAAKGCFKDIRVRNNSLAGKEPSAYCSDACAFSSSGELLVAMLQYRDLLCLFSSESMQPLLAAVKNQKSSTATIGSHPSAGTRGATAAAANVPDSGKTSSPSVLKRLASQSKGDVEAFGCNSNHVTKDPENALAEMMDAMQRQNMLTVEVSKLGSSLPVQLIAPHGVKKSALSTAPSPRDVDSKKGKIIQQLASALPKAAMSVYCKGTEEAVNATAGSGENVDLAFRSRARYVMEEFFMKQLSTMNIAGALFLGSMLAMELEEGLYRKCAAVAPAPAPPSGTNPGGQSATQPLQKPVLNRTEYGKQQLKLMRNLKQSHNEQLIMKLVTCELTSEKLLGMSEKELADFTTRQLREKQSSTTEQESILRTSTQEVLEARQRNTMSGQQESWRGGSGAGTGVVLDSDNGGGGDSSNQQNEMDMTEDGGSAGNGKKRRLYGEGEVSKGEGDGKLPDGRSLEIEKKVHSESKQAAKSAAAATGTRGAAGTKRSIDVDAGSRFVGLQPTSPSISAALSASSGDEERPAKLKKLELDALDSSSPSPRSKGPSVLDLLRNKSAAAPLSPTAEDPNAVAQTTVSELTGFAAALRSGSFEKLLTSAGSFEMVITKPGGIVIECVAYSTNSQVQNLVRPKFDIEGRTKIEELDKYIKDVLQQGKKAVAVCVLLVEASQAGPGSGYVKFCEEFCKDRRAGTSNITKTGSVSFYTIPPQLKKFISVLSSAPDRSEGDNEAVLYGVIIAKDIELSKRLNAVPAIIQPASTVKASTILSSSSTSGSDSQPDVLKTVPIKNVDLIETSSRPIVAPPLLPPPKSSIPTLLPKTTAFSNLPLKLPTPSLPIGPTSSLKGLEFGSGLKSSNQPAPQDEKTRKETMLKIANFCATKGIHNLQMLREKEESKNLMPFLYENNPGYAEFSKILKECLESKSS